MTDRPDMRAVYDRLAEQLGPQVSELTGSDRFAEIVEVADALRSRAGDELQRSSRRFLHAVNLPAGSDVTVLRQEIGALERTVRTLARQVETLQRQLDEANAPEAAALPGASESSAERKSGKKKTATKKKGT